MGNSFFKFKRFTVHQEQAGMKVTTDACLFGAIAANNAAKGALQVLDIGAGTGLLSLMLAQQLPHATIDALEPEPAAAAQANENFIQSPWANRLQLHPCDVQSFRRQHLYDLIICNPPFFSNSLQGNDLRKNQALHNDTLPPDVLALHAARLLATHGSVYILLPPFEYAVLQKELEAKELYAQQEWHIRQTPAHHVFRIAARYSGVKPASVITTALSIKEADNYSPAFSALLQPYYLYL
jgi:tRNA1Val (adenine37-N6)-methyltransferase